MKEFIDKILSAKYTGYIALVLAVIIVIVAIYLITMQYGDSKDTSLSVSDGSHKNEVIVYKSNNDTKVDSKEEKTAIDKVVEEKISFANDLEVFFKGKSVGVVSKYTKADTLTFENLKKSITSKNTIKVTLDQVLSIDISKLNKKTINSIKNIKAVIYGKDGTEVFNSKVSNMYGNISIAIDALAKSDEYYGLIEITTDSEEKNVRYIFKF